MDVMSDCPCEYLTKSGPAVLVAVYPSVGRQRRENLFVLRRPKGRTKTKRLKKVKCCEKNWCWVTSLDVGHFFSLKVMKQAPSLIADGSGNHSLPSRSFGLSERGTSPLREHNSSDVFCRKPPCVTLRRGSCWKAMNLCWSLCCRIEMNIENINTLIAKIEAKDQKAKTILASRFAAPAMVNFSFPNQKHLKNH